MHRPACLNIPLFELQVLLKHRPHWRELPAVVTSTDKPQGIVQAANTPARAAGVRNGMKYAAALSLCPDLVADTPAAELFLSEQQQLSTVLSAFTPDIEVYQPGVYWLNAEGMGRLYGTSHDWLESLCKAVATLGFQAGIALGWSRFGSLVVSYRVAQGTGGSCCIDSPQEEQALMQAAPLRVLPLNPRILDRLTRLGIATVADFVALPTDGVRKRFGDAVLRLHQFASGIVHGMRIAVEPPRPQCGLQPAVAATADAGGLQTRVIRWKGTAAVADFAMIITQTQQLVAALLTDVTAAMLLLVRLHMRFRGEDRPAVDLNVAPAQPTDQLGLMSKLVGVRLERSLRDAVFAEPIDEIQVWGSVVRPKGRVGDLFEQAVVRDRRRAVAALALIRAEWGERSVCKARLLPRHLPEHAFEWVTGIDTEAPMPLPELLDQPVPAALPVSQMVRRIVAQPRATVQPSRQLAGPYLTNGGWWGRPIFREYAFFATECGRIVWAFRRSARSPWFVHGWIE